MGIPPWVFIIWIWYHENTGFTIFDYRKFKNPIYRYIPKTGIPKPIRRYKERKPETSDFPWKKCVKNKPSL